MEFEGFHVIFWDFDGVIKDSVDIKTHAFESLFADCGPEILKKIRAHHESNGGMSRLNKIPLYMRWANMQDDEMATTSLLNKFSELVLQAVIDSPWVPGSLECIRN
jgi:beta-phosphoglucomutase-like phosphatase (HAD superfamily)